MGDSLRLCARLALTASTNEAINWSVSLRAASATPNNASANSPFLRWLQRWRWVGSSKFFLGED